MTCRSGDVPEWVCFSLSNLPDYGKRTIDFIGSQPAGTTILSQLECASPQSRNENSGACPDVLSLMFQAGPMPGLGQFMRGREMFQQGFGTLAVPSERLTREALVANKNTMSGGGEVEIMIAQPEGVRFNAARTPEGLTP